MTGIRSVDDLWEGLYPGELNILAARSKHGKTAFAMQVAEHVARLLPAGEHVQIFSLEMKRKDLALRMLASATGIPANELRKGQIGGARAQAVVVARRDLRSLALIVQDAPGMTLADIRIAARLAVRRRKVRLIVIDHLQRIKPDKTMQRMDARAQVQHVTETLKDLREVARCSGATAGADLPPVRASRRPGQPAPARIGPDVWRRAGCRQHFTAVAPGTLSGGEAANLAR